MKQSTKPDAQVTFAGLEQLLEYLRVREQELAEQSRAVAERIADIQKQLWHAGIEAYVGADDGAGETTHGDAQEGSIV